MVKEEEKALAYPWRVRSATVVFLHVPRLLNDSVAGARLSVKVRSMPATTPSRAGAMVKEPGSLPWKFYAACPPRFNASLALLRLQTEG